MGIDAILHSLSRNATGAGDEPLRRRSSARACPSDGPMRDLWRAHMGHAAWSGVFQRPMCGQSKGGPAVKLEYPDMIYAEFVERAMNADGPVTEIRPVGDTRAVYSAAQYDDETETCWRADIDHDARWDGGANVKFARCNPLADHEFVRDWTPLATGSLSGPQKLAAWQSLFAVFDAAVEFFNEEYYG